MNAVKRTLFTGWYFMRWIRLIFGVFAVGAAVLFNDSLMGVIGGFFLLTAVTNTGCCGAGGCAVPTQNNQTKEPEEIGDKKIAD